MGSRAGGTVKWMDEEDVGEPAGVLMWTRSERRGGASSWTGGV